MIELTRQRAILAAVLAVAAVLRIAAANGELWFDEVWSIRLVEQDVKSPADVVLRLKHDNNHMLNSLVVYFVGPEGGSWSYRWPAVLAGIATVALAGWVARRRGFATQLAAMALVGGSYFLVHYSSEARGYAYQMFFMLLAYAALWEAEGTGRAKWEWLFAASCILGFLAQPLFLTVYLAAQVWSWIPWPRVARRDIALRLVCRTIVPGLYFGWLYWVNLRHMTVGGGLEQPYVEVIVTTLSLFCGGPFHAPWAYAAAALTVAVTVIAFWSISAHRRRWMLYLYLIVMMPLTVLLIAQRDDLYPRYFLGSVLFLCLLWAEMLGMLYDRSEDGRVWYRVLLAAFIVANGVHIAQLITYGRNSYVEALKQMELRTPGDRIELLMDHPLRQQLMIERYGHRATTKPLHMSLPTEETAQSAEWILAHDVETDFVPGSSIGFPTGDNFELVEVYPYAGLSGWNLALYRRATPAPSE
jgi:hypothetical protein